MSLGTKSISTKQLIADNRERVYRALKERDFDLYRRCIQAGEAVSLTYGCSHQLAADIESAIVLMVADAMGV